MWWMYFVISILMAILQQVLWDRWNHTVVVGTLQYKENRLGSFIMTVVFGPVMLVVLVALLVFLLIMFAMNWVTQKVTGKTIEAYDSLKETIL